jgi:tetratricopeptide (TPR) repeat protein
MWMRRNPVATLLLGILVAAVAIGIGAQMVSIQRIRSARAASEGFIGFMNQDLADDLRYVGRLDLMEKINARAEDYYTNYTALGDTGYMERKARFFENSASTEEDLGHLVRADAFAAEAERIYESQGRLAPSDGRWKRLLSRVRVLRLHIAKDGGLRTAAYAHGDAAVVAASEALALNPTDSTNQANLGKVLLAQVEFWVSQGRAEVSATNVAKADKLLRDATRSPAADPEWQLSLVSCDYYRARISQLRRAHDTALEKFTEYLGNLQELAARFPRNTKWQFELAIAHSHVAGALTQLEQYSQAQPYLEAFERVARTLTSLDPRNTTWLSLYGKSLAWRGVADDTLHPKSTNGLHYLHLALSIQSNLVHQNPDWDQWAVNAEETTKAILARHQRDGRTREALDLSADWLRQCEERALNAPNHVGHQLRWGQAIAADVRLNSRDDELARQTERMRAALYRFATLAPGQATVLAKARVISAVADSLERGGDPAAAVKELRKALELRLAFFASAPRSARIKDFMIANNFLWMVTYHLRAHQNGGAVAVAEEALNWAARNLAADDGRKDLSQLCWVLTQRVSASDPEFGKVRELVQRCITERFPEPPPLSKDDEANVGRLRDWIAAHP